MVICELYYSFEDVLCVVSLPLVFHELLYFNLFSFPSSLLTLSSLAACGINSLCCSCFFFPWILSVFVSHVLELHLFNPALPLTSAKCQMCWRSKQPLVADLSISGSCCVVGKRRAAFGLLARQMLEVRNPQVNDLRWKKSYEEQLFRNRWLTLTLCLGVWRGITQRQSLLVGKVWNLNSISLS